MKRPHIVLAIESAINGGSLSLLRDGYEISHWIGSASVSKAEALLVNIDAMLQKSGVSQNEINMVAVSAGPGSFTGIRIGIATALGLKNGLNIEMSSVSAMAAVVAATEVQGTLVAAVPTGRNAICVQDFKSNGNLSSVSEPHTITEAAFADALRTKQDIHFVLHDSLCSFVDESTSFTNAGVNIAQSIGRYCSARPATVVEPLFVSKSF
ncbi:MAG: tRNA (adenosine(37)-N6)-threonylcarbamoyltransferase complex dimerization subunit type 1 TsaB [Pyrinomonadaceae bacterium]|nr:tRNA (adenosine(37)-N6)-threonylcarbamoyltransferase complex dimerization subunit type 1 TsaB [Chloracidobacterium sp.]MBP7415973.1 tRNA (adenosine(37)-N6)-threonylcarbamoyltransferase complex dimerization subunit type 1 TsaB [Pyrinomonadaceae bacterium]